MSTPITPTRLQSLHSGLTLLAIALAPRSWRAEFCRKARQELRDRVTRDMATTPTRLLRKARSGR